MGASTVWANGKLMNSMRAGCPEDQAHAEGEEDVEQRHFRSDFAKARKSASIMVFMGRSFSVR